ncbi:S41 family peptidase [Mucilaginibacter sp. UR6-11]|uniref:S41 family peptidase n=1 Tax=Mucilaginibacter sp. UR6-11 TaxID=1435644 RepID=UPI001E619D36|nr:S41 family peptidase [Mucilaginibacter sp. UR6-11]MCC8424797.1 hypothetical protein [Mucilaginibacter sp. UR6-11]
MKNILLAFVFCGVTTNVAAPKTDPDHKFSPRQLKADLAFMEKQLFDAHADPFTELSRPAYENVFAGINARLKDSMTATAFFKLIKPCIAPLSDEHSQLSIDTALQTGDYKNGTTFLPFSLLKKGKLFIVDELLAEGTGLQKGQAINAINDEPVSTCLARCAGYSTGFPSQRMHNALEQFGYLYTISRPGTYYSFRVKTATGKLITLKGVKLSAWQNYMTAKSGQNSGQDHEITYTRYGNAGYLNASSFYVGDDRQLDSLKKQLSGMFKQMKVDGVTSLFIDVSRNSGGNSAVGDALIGHFYDKPYRNYQCNFRRSDEYLNLLRSWGFNDEAYAREAPGKLIHSESSESYPPANDPDRFKGKVYVIVGNGTFSSAMMFATVIKDNHIATLAGQIPAEGHPNHFGELYNTKLPNTRLDLRFGVKEWVRPAGKTSDNVLRPDIIINVDKTPEEMIKAITK